MMQFWADIKYSFRLLRKTPVFSGTLLLIIVMSLSLYLAGFTIGAMMGKEPMPFPLGDSFVSLRARDATTGGDVGRHEHDTYFLNRLRESTDNYVELGAYNRSNYVLSDGEFSERYAGFSISTDLIRATETNPVLGRLITDEDAQPGAENVVLLSYTVWQEYYNADTTVIGRIALVNGTPHSIIGVMPDQFQFPSPAQLWTPLTTDDAAIPGEGLPLTIVGVLKDDRSYSQAEAELTAVLEREAGSFPDNYANRVGFIHDYADGFAGDDISPNPVTGINATTLMILVLAIVNLSSMLFIRLNARKQELLVRSSVGANGWQLSKQIMLESFMICFIGLILSIMVSALLLALFEYAMLEQGLAGDSWWEFQLSLEAVFTGFIAVIVIWLTSCFFVSLRAFQSNPSDVMESSNKGSEAVASSTTRLIVSFELLLSCFLLVSCGVLFHLARQAVNTDYGTEPDGLAVAFMNLSDTRYDTLANRITYIKELQSKIVEIPGVQQVAMTSALPQRYGVIGSYSIQGQEEVSDNFAPTAMTVWVSDSYFETIDVSLLSGRDFDLTDTESSSRVTILSQAFAQQLWPNESAIGKEISVTLQNETEPMRVVGIVQNLPQGRTDIVNPQPVLYRPLTQNPPRNLSVVVRHEPQYSADILGAEIRRSASDVDRNIPLFNVRSLEDQIVNDQEGISIFGNISALFAIVTLILAAMGIYSVMARSILYRTHEIGVRRALGSSDLGITWKFLKQSLRFLVPTTVVGAGLGTFMIVTAASSLGIRDMAFLPYIVSLVVLVMVTIVLTATYLPSQKAIAMEPGDALRYE